MFFNCSPEFIGWALQPPGWIKEWHCGVRVAKSNKLVGFISAVPAHVRIYTKSKHMVSPMKGTGNQCDQLEMNEH